MAELLKNATVSGTLHLAAGSSLTTEDGVTIDLSNATVTLPASAIPAVPTFTGSTSTTAGTKGLVPAPAAGDNVAGKYLSAAGTWATPAGGGGSGTTVGTSTVGASDALSDTFNSSVWNSSWSPTPEANLYGIASTLNGDGTATFSFTNARAGGSGDTSPLREIQMVQKPITLSNYPAWAFTLKYRLHAGSAPAAGSRAGIMLFNNVAGIYLGFGVSYQADGTARLNLEHYPSPSRLVTVAPTNIPLPATRPDGDHIWEHLSLSGADWLWIRMQRVQNPQNPQTTGNFLELSYSTDGVNFTAITGQPIGADLYFTASGGSLLSINGVAVYMNINADGDPLFSIDADSFQVILSTNTSLDLPAVPEGMANPMIAGGDMIAGGAAGAPQRIPAGANGQVLTMAGGAPSWENATGGGDGASLITTAGDIVVGDADGLPVRLGRGTNGQVLTVVGGVLAWATPAAGGGANTNPDGTSSDGLLLDFDATSGVKNPGLSNATAGQKVARWTNSATTSPAAAVTLEQADSGHQPTFNGTAVCGDGSTVSMITTDLSTYFTAGEGTLIVAVVMNAPGDFGLGTTWGDDEPGSSGGYFVAGGHSYTDIFRNGRLVAAELMPTSGNHVIAFTSGPAGGFQIYDNGTLLATHAADWRSAVRLRLFQDCIYGNLNFTRAMLYTRELTAAEIITNYNILKGPLGL